MTDFVLIYYNCLKNIVRITLYKDFFIISLNEILINWSDFNDKNIFFLSCSALAVNLMRSAMPFAFKTTLFQNQSVLLFSGASSNVNLNKLERDSTN